MAPISGAGLAGDTIFALASGMGLSAISVIRLSGPQCGAVLAKMAGRLPAPRYASLRILSDDSGAVLDRALVLWFPGPGSYTGEDSAELQLHGGRAVLDAVTATLIDHGTRPAHPGEFTRRAFANGKIDLLEAEAIGDLISAETQAQRLQALDQASGALSRLVAAWTSRLTRSVAWQEAMIDFVEDVPDQTQADLLSSLILLRDELRANNEGVLAGERLRRGLVFTIVGPPNAGKSSLLNALAQQDLAIVSHNPGTTRDAVRADIVLGDIPVTLIDTAGFRETDDPVEGEGVRRAQLHAGSADLVIEIADSRIGRVPIPVQPHICIGNKIDLAAPPKGCFGLSLRTGAGLPELVTWLTKRARDLANPGANALFNRARHRAALRDAEAGVTAAINTSRPELRAEELRFALQALGRITGSSSSDAILDVVFSDFCVGK